MEKVIKGSTDAKTYDYYCSGVEVSTISCAGLSDGEVIEIEEASGENWVPMTPAKQLTALNPSLNFQSPFDYRINKPVTAAATAIYIKC